MVRSDSGVGVIKVQVIKCLSTSKSIPYWPSLCCMMFLNTPRPMIGAPSYGSRNDRCSIAVGRKRTPSNMSITFTVVVAICNLYKLLSPKNTCADA